MRNSRCDWIGSCSLCPRIEDDSCPCKEEKFKYYLYILKIKDSTLHCKAKSNNYNDIFIELGKFLKSKIAKSFIKENKVDITITLDGEYSWRESINLIYKIR